VSDWTPDIALLRQFDDQEWLRVERAFCGRLLAYVTRRVPDRGAREDIVQEAFLGAVRGIGDFDPTFTFEQYLFGICKNRTIDHLRRVKVQLVGAALDDDEGPSIDDLAREEETPSRIVRQKDLETTGMRVLQEILRTWVQETWAESEFTRLMVIEALFAANWRNRDTWERFGLRDETSVAGIKFRALKRLREIAMERDTQKTVLPLLSAAVDNGEALDLDVRNAWRDGRVSCPARHWLARLAAGGLPPGPTSFLRFHLDEMHCAWCQANADDLAELDAVAELEPLLERMGASTVQFLRSRTVR
jgi:RNA polymerase sigma factor (sigma-70 family)